MDEEPPTGGEGVATDDETAARLVEAVVAGRPRADARLVAHLRTITDSGRRAVVLDPLARAAAGSGRALEVLLTAVQSEGLAMATIHRLVIDHHDAEDVEQDVLINVARSVGSFRGDARFTTWLHQLVRNVAIDFLRRRKEAVSLDENRPATAAGRLSSLVADREVVVEAVAGLADEYRLAVALRDVQGLSYREIADRLDLPLNTVKSRIHRGRALLAGLIDLDAADNAGSGAGTASGEVAAEEVDGDTGRSEESGG